MHPSRNGAKLAEKYIVALVKEPYKCVHVPMQVFLELEAISLSSDRAVILNPIVGPEAITGSIYSYVYQSGLAKMICLAKCHVLQPHILILMASRLERF